MIDLSLIDTAQQSSQYGLGRLFLEDPRDFNFLMEQKLEEEGVPQLPTYKYWRTGKVLNQGQTPRCVEFSWNQHLVTSPTRHKLITPTGTLYCESQKLDPWIGDCDNPQYDGSTVRAGAKALSARGLLASYLWAYDAQTVRAWVLGKGPVVVGTRWYRSMSDDTPYRGVIRVDTNTMLDGGHAYLISGYNDKTGLFRVTNSWGTDWAQGGRAWLRFDDLDLLLDQRGEACTAIEVTI